MSAKLTAKQRWLLSKSAKWTYCGYSPALKEAADSLETLGLGVVSESDLGPVFRRNVAGRAAIQTSPSEPLNARTQGVEVGR